MVKGRKTGSIGSGSAQAGEDDAPCIRGVSQICARRRGVPRRPRRIAAVPDPDSSHPLRRTEAPRRPRQRRTRSLGTSREPSHAPCATGAAISTGNFTNEEDGVIRACAFVSLSFVFPPSLATSRTREGTSLEGGGKTVRYNQLFNIMLAVHAKKILVFPDCSI